MSCEESGVDVFEIRSCLLAIRQGIIIKLTSKLVDVIFSCFNDQLSMAALLAPNRPQKNFEQGTRSCGKMPILSQL
jgi:hypothetical protein